MNTYSFNVCTDIPWDEISSTFDSNVYKCQHWMDHLYESCGVKPYVIEISLDGSIIGWLVAGIVKKYGFKIVASPFEGWATSYQGLSLKRRMTVQDRLDIIEQLKNYLFKNGVLLFQISDYQIDYNEISARNFYSEPINSYVLDISLPIDQLFKTFKQKSCQYCIHKAKKEGVIIQKPESLSAFGHEYYEQLKDVFNKQNLKPTYSEDRVQSLLHSLDSDKELIALEALHPETKKTMACIIFVLHNQIGFYWGASSWREYQKTCPNEILMFEGIKILKERGCLELEMEGIRPYKEKYNPQRYSKPKLIFAKYRIIIWLKNFAKWLFYGQRNLFSKFKPYMVELMNIKGRVLNNQVITKRGGDL